MYRETMRKKAGRIWPNHTVNTTRRSKARSRSVFVSPNSHTKKQAHSQRRRRRIASRVAAFGRWLFTTEYFPKTTETICRVAINPFFALCVITVLTSLCGWLVAPQVYLLSAASFCVLVVGVVYPWLAIRAIECRLSFPNAYVREGESALPTLTVQNKWPIPIWGLAIQDRFYLAEASEQAVMVSLAHVPLWSRTNFQWSFTPLRRGVYPRSATYVTCAFPFGLWVARKQVVVEGKLLVRPCYVDVSELQRMTRATESSGELVNAFRGASSDCGGIRVYQPGDGIRDVHWKATARANELMVKERPSSSANQLRVVLSVEGSTNRICSAQRDICFDTAVRIVAGFCQASSQAGLSIKLVLGQTSIQVATPLGIRQAMDALATVQANDFNKRRLDHTCHQTAEVRVIVELSQTQDDETGHAAVVVCWSHRGETRFWRVDGLTHAPGTTQQLANLLLHVKSALQQDGSRLGNGVRHA